MALEIERKFLVVNDDFRDMATSSTRIVQGYLSADPRATVRVRVMGDRGYITVKSKNVGATRHEWEYEVPITDAEQMMAIAQGAVVDKTRYIVPFGGREWEIDEFRSPRPGLVVAEIELPSADAEIAIPTFVGEEVTGRPEYYNSNMSQAEQ